MRPGRLQGLQVGAPVSLRGAEVALTPLPKPPQGEEGIQPQPPALESEERQKDRACLGAPGGEGRPLGAILGPSAQADVSQAGPGR